jgi:hypothetical protein
LIERVTRPTRLSIAQPAEKFESHLLGRTIQFIPTLSRCQHGFEILSTEQESSKVVCQGRPLFSGTYDSHGAAIFGHLVLPQGL